jgi:hypothetical protein
MNGVSALRQATMVGDSNKAFVAFNLLHYILDYSFPLPLASLARRGTCVARILPVSFTACVFRLLLLVQPCVLQVL